jgi:hypothetical protein
MWATEEILPALAAKGIFVLDGSNFEGVVVGPSTSHDVWLPTETKPEDWLAFLTDAKSYPGVAELRAWFFEEALPAIIMSGGYALAA